MPVSITVTWSLGDMYHPPPPNTPLVFLGLLKWQDSVGTDGVICSFPEEEVP